MSYEIPTRGLANFQTRMQSLEFVYDLLHMISIPNQSAPM